MARASAVRPDLVAWQFSIDPTTKIFWSVGSHKLALKDVWKRRFEFINDWERLLVEEENTTIPQILLVHIEGRAASPLQGASRRSGGNGKSATAIIPSASFGISTLTRSRQPFQSVRPNRPRGSSSRRTTSGSGIYWMQIVADAMEDAETPGRCQSRRRVDLQKVAALPSSRRERPQDKKFRNK